MRTSVAAKVTLLMLVCAGSQMAGAWDQPFLANLNASDALRTTQDSLESAGAIIWTLKTAAVVSASFLLLFTAKRLQAEDYQGALWSFVAAMIAGASPFFAETLFLG